MNNKITLTVVVLLIILGGGYVLSQQMMKPKVPGAVTNLDTGKSGPPMTSLKELLASGKPQTCEYEYSNEKTGESKGITYIADGKMRADYEGTYADGKSYSGSMINDGTYVYMWSSAQPQGMKMKITAVMNAQIENAQQNPAYVDPNTPLNYRCTPWGTDAAKFAPPATIQFMDYSQQMEQIRKNMQTEAPGTMEGQGTDSVDMKKAQCDACESMEGEQKTACKTALKCT